ncbi:MAG: hypothetical protein V3V03_01410 [Hyphomonadaceae bacterium]
MQEEELLIGISQLGIGFAGFISIFMVFARRDGTFSAPDSIFVRAIIVSSFLIAAGALTPLVVAGFELSTPNIWRYSAISVLVISAVPTTNSVRKQVSLSSEDRAQIGTLFSILVWSLAAAIVVLYGLVAFGIGGGPLYILSLALNIGLVMVTFATFALRRLL